MLARRLAIEQLEIAKALIKRGNDSSLRIALILLDNFVEISMFKKIGEHTRHDDFLGPTLSVIPDKELSPQLLELKSKILSKKKKYKLERYFHEKVNYLSLVHKDIEPELGEFLTALHTYRNAAYHSQKVKNDIIKTLTILLFGICCDLFVKFEPDSSSWSSDYDIRDWTLFFDKYGIHFNPGIMGDKGTWQIVIQQVRNGLELTISELHDELNKHLTRRLTDTGHLIDFLNRDMPSMRKDFPYTRLKLQKWQKQSEGLEQEKDRISLFNLFIRIENDFKPFEEEVEKLSSELDEWIQMQIDIARGK